MKIGEMDNIARGFQPPRIDLVSSETKSLFRIEALLEEILRRLPEPPEDKEPNDKEIGF